MKEERDERLRARIRKVVKNRNQTRSARRFDTGDIVQETVLQLWKQGMLPTDSQESIEVDQALLATMAKGHLAKNIRNHHAAKRDVDREQAVDPIQLTKDDSPLERMMKLEQSDAMQAALNQLEATERIVIYRRFFGKSTTTRIAEDLGLPVDVVRGHLKRGVRNLKRLLQAPEEND